MNTNLISFLKNQAGGTLIPVMIAGVVVAGLGSYIVSRQSQQEKIMQGQRGRIMNNVLVREIGEALSSAQTCRNSFTGTLANERELSAIVGESGTMYAPGSLLKGSTQEIDRMVLKGYTGGGGQRLSSAILKVFVRGARRDGTEVKNTGFGGRQLAYDVPMVFLTTDNVVTTCVADLANAVVPALNNICTQLNGVFDSASGVCTRIHGPQGWTLGQVSNFLCSTAGTPCAHPLTATSCPQGPNWIIRGFLRGSQGVTMDCVCVPRDCPNPADFCAGTDLGNDFCGTVCPVGTRSC